jgi:hypothetical protein
MEITIKYLPTTYDLFGKIERFTTEIANNAEHWQARFVLQNPSFPQIALFVERRELNVDEERYEWCQTREFLSWNQPGESWDQGLDPVEEYIAWLSETVEYVLVDGISLWENPSTVTY